MLAVTVNPRVEKSFKLEEVPTPIVGPEDVLIKIRAAALNHRDLYVNNGGWSYVGHASDQLIKGGDGAGVIVAIGANVTDWAVGDEVMLNPNDMSRKRFLGGPDDGTLSEYVKWPADAIVSKPQYLSFEEAAAIPLALSTAWGTVVTKGEIQKGETVLIQGIGSGVALFNLQLLVKIGAKVIVTSSSDEKLQRAIELGAVQGINYKTENVVNKVLEATDGKGADVVIDSNGKDSINISINSLSKNGRLLVFGSTTGRINWDELRGKSYFVETGMVDQAQLQEALHYYTNEKLHPILSERIYKLEEFKEAYQELEDGKQFGKIVIRVQN